MWEEVTLLKSQKNCEDMAEEWLVPELINGLVVAKQMSGQLFFLSFFHPQTFLVALERVTWFPNLTYGCLSLSVTSRERQVLNI